MRVAAAGACGVADAYGHLHRLDRDQALAEVAEVAGQVPTHQRQEVLDRAAARYLGPTPVPWHRAALELLAAAGANLERAGELAAGPRQRGLYGLGEYWRDRPADQ